MKEREPRYVSIRQKLANRADRTGILTPRAAALTTVTAGSAARSHRTQRSTDTGQAAGRGAATGRWSPTGGGRRTEVEEDEAPTSNGAAGRAPGRQAARHRVGGPPSASSSRKGKARAKQRRPSPLTPASGSPRPPWTGVKTAPDGRADPGGQVPWTGWSPSNVRLRLFAARRCSTTSWPGSCSPRTAAGLFVGGRPAV